MRVAAERPGKLSARYFGDLHVAKLRKPREQADAVALKDAIVRGPVGISGIMARQRCGRKGDNGDEFGETRKPGRKKRTAETKEDLDRVSSP